MEHIISWEELQRNRKTYLFQGSEYGNIPISFFMVHTTTPGGGPKLHKHPYEEIFVIQEGQATFTIGDATMAVHGGQTVVAPANTPHKFKNAGDGLLQMINIHPSTRIITEWLED